MADHRCPICAEPMRPMIDMPAFPITERYERWAKSFEEGRGFIDQSFLYCTECSHGRLGTVIPPADLYGDGYMTRTAASIGSMRAVENFAAFVREHTDLAAVKTVIDIGGNDASLVSRFPDQRRVVVDPNASGEGATLVRAFAQDADLSPWKADPKIVLCSHTLEHVEDVQAFVASIGAVVDYGDKIAFQFPSLELLTRGAHFTQIHHQHIHYFSERSSSLFFGKCGYRIIASRFDAEHYGALMLIAERGNADQAPKAVLTEGTIRWQHSLFKRIMHTASQRIDPSYIALGASLMLPVLVYWVPSLKYVEFIADNDKKKEGLRYVNFNKRIRTRYRLKGRNVVLTATTTKLAARALLAQAFKQGAQDVIAPVAVL